MLFSEACGGTGDSPLRVVSGLRFVLPLGFKLANQSLLADAFLEEGANASPIAFALAISFPTSRRVLRAGEMGLLVTELGFPLAVAGLEVFQTAFQLSDVLRACRHEEKM